MTSEGRVVVFGYSEVGYLCLELLIQRGVNVVAVFTHEDNPGETRWFRSVAELAGRHRIPVHTPTSLKDPAWTDRIRELSPDLILSFYYRSLIPTRILNLATRGAFNMHGSYLPKYRGKAPVNWAVLHGETEIGATLHVMVKEPDAGDIVDQEKVRIGPDETAFEVMQKVQTAAVLVLDRQIDALLAGNAPRHPQDHSRATYFSGRKPEDGRIDWTQPASSIANLVRAVTKPYPGAFTDFQGTRLLVWRARTGNELASGDAAPGTVLGLDPVTIATGDGTLEILDAEWTNLPGSEPAAAFPELSVGDVL